ncbi:pyridoxamine 5'-phosphate oxidase family protein [Herbiconiux sp. CPCC 205763]|uniref:Pyridoxamine 5'-phosphate oxidase family protein n=1 Tax=Herbiconiux aconitum TaxID=2970913 RepID=A0ABT2GK24_9MICO|nr:pyridoxamine 5'-phosphate oxidase family protein [Herbiconiux aconitum]MCS5716562.1 pyridoxamine 5'-phosphate oxidase family protein [Herbiconiux aconitum]
MWQGEGDVHELDSEECWELLRSQELGRLAMGVGGEIDIFPVNYLAERDSILLRTAPGTKLLELVIAPNAAFEIDGYSDEEAWSVVLKGTAYRLERQSEIDEADRLPLTPWIPTLKYEYVRIAANSVSGRRFRRGPEPDRY